MKHLKVLNGSANYSKDGCGPGTVDYCNGYDGGVCSGIDVCTIIDLGDCHNKWDICINVDHCTPGKIDIPE